MPVEMQKDIRQKIAALKIEMGEWGKGRRVYYLMENMLEIDCETERLENQYSDNYKQDGDFNERYILNYLIKKWEKRKNKMAKELGSLLYKDNTNTKITDDDITTAKEYPIENIIEFKKGKALCPFHDDHNPSMSVKNNRYRCWSCGAKGDSINLVMELQKLEFREAVKYLKGRA